MKPRKPIRRISASLLKERYLTTENPIGISFGDERGYVSMSSNLRPRPAARHIIFKP
jgi:hypothetical protein